MQKHFSTPRLAALDSFFVTTSHRDALGCYAWNQAVSAGFLPLLADVEVSLRNALHRALSQYFHAVDSSDWMMPRPNPAHGINPAAPVQLPPVHKLTPKAREDVVSAMGKIKARKPAGYLVSPDDVVAALPFGFWEVLIAGLAHRSQPPGLQAAILAAAFPYAADTATTPYGSQDFRMRLVKLLKRIRDIRNRIGHHEALWSTPEFNVFGVLGHIPRRPRHTVNSLRKFAEKLSWFGGWIDPGISAYMQNNDHWWSLQVLLQRQALATYRVLGGAVGTYRRLLEATRTPANGTMPTLRTRHKRHKRRIVDRYYF
ncbi:hypothetical protein G5B88_21030 [Herbaspirillum seropedicae]|uniref:Abi family protein n=2 Tax=Herbaspirillum seropedicae TaxID=964 RepID=D8ITI9_HERSS|nr:hypothetical protein Hsero_4149 [Herbaspirillum seropedicae SmR1]AKN67438.1 hypothetical protein ACP92_20710 [Herbaspirillum seropedicae]NQE32029.1 hypothetical protein [Herbaspirillum seropedicae]UMU24369.1 hypothetical protein G5B88_21030 [Herbaspirillum seropedicae]